jgi:hypothetical protein
VLASAGGVNVMSQPQKEQKPEPKAAPAAPAQPAGLKVIHRIHSEDGFKGWGPMAKIFEVQTDAKAARPKAKGSSCRPVKALEWHPAGVRVTLLEPARDGGYVFVIPSGKIDAIEEFPE